MTDRKPTPAQLEALKYVCTHGPVSRPGSYQHHGARVRRDTWGRCHEFGWLKSDKGRHWLSLLTEAGRKVVDP